MKKVIIVGAGITGATLAERFARHNYRVEVIEQRAEIGGNCYDYCNRYGIYVHKYGPHIFHTDNRAVWRYLSRFTDWRPYRHQVLAYVDRQLIPIPFNLNSLIQVFPAERAKSITQKLIKCYGFQKKIPILELTKNSDPEIKQAARYVYKKIFLNYTRKQWGMRPEKLDQLVTARIPVLTSYCNDYFSDRYQGIPKQGYTKMISKMLKHPNIKLRLKTKFIHSQKLNYDRLIYTGPLDEFYRFRYGKLGYRCLIMKFSDLARKNYQSCAVINYPNNFKFTRITEFKKFANAKSSHTTIVQEYPGSAGFRAYPILIPQNKRILARYNQAASASRKKRIWFAGRLANYKYYDMDDAVKNALDLFKKINRRH